MTKNERIIAQDLAELKHAIQTQDTGKINESCKILSRDIKKYPVRPEVIARLEHISGYPEVPTLTVSSSERVKEIGTLIDILTR
ncbi:MAG: hypothetical protein OEW49_03840 [Nitrosopumilus sp.]|nr:hypothetical protein [Nitrosopumilus sp.]